MCFDPRDTVMEEVTECDSRRCSTEDKSFGDTVVIREGAQQMRGFFNPTKQSVKPIHLRLHASSLNRISNVPIQRVCPMNREILVGVHVPHAEERP